MNGCTKLVRLLGCTDGRDKLYMSLTGILRIAATVAAQRNDPHAQDYKALEMSIESARSLMRMGRFINCITKLESLRELFVAQGLRHTERKKFVEFVMTIFDGLFVLLDSVAFTARFNIITVNSRQVYRSAKICQLWTFVLSTVLHLFHLRDAVRRLEYDPPAAKRSARRAGMRCVQDFIDVLVTMAAVGYVKRLWCPSDVTSGAMICLSGSIATSLNWEMVQHANHVGSVN